MISNKEKILAHYEEYTAKGGEDSRSTASRSAGLEFHYTKKILGDYIRKNHNVFEVGCGTGYYVMHFADKCAEYTGIDLFPHHIEIFQNKINVAGFKNVSCRVGDATNLEGVVDSGYDIVLCFGPMYHLPPEGRESVFSECARICKPGGIIAFSFINKIGAYLAACLHDEWREVYPNKNANNHILNLGTDDNKPGVFFFTTPEDMEEAAARHGLLKVRSSGLNFFNLTAIADKMDDEKFEAYLEILNEAVKLESCTGMSEHALLICEKKC